MALGERSFPSRRGLLERHRFLQGQRTLKAWVLTLPKGTGADWVNR